MNAAPAIDRALRKLAEAPKTYDIDAEAIAKVLVKHYGDEAEDVLGRAIEWLPVVRRTKR